MQRPLVQDSVLSIPQSINFWQEALALLTEHLPWFPCEPPLAVLRCQR